MYIQSAFANLKLTSEFVVISIYMVLETIGMFT